MGELVKVLSREQRDKVCAHITKISLAAFVGNKLERVRLEAGDLRSGCRSPGERKVPDLGYCLWGWMHR